MLSFISDEPHGPYSMETYDIFISFGQHGIQHLIRNNEGQIAQKVPEDFIDIIIFHILYDKKN